MENMIRVFAIVFMAFGWLHGAAQQTTWLNLQLSGRVTDSAGIALSKATVQLAAGVDTLVTVSGDDGSFVFHQAAARKFQLIVTMRGYLTFSQWYALPEGESNVTLQPVRMGAAYGELDPVLVTRVRSITIQGDTISFNAAAFPVREGSEVEEILKRLPGVEVDINGNVVIQGKPLTRVLVNGKEFFGSDVLLAIQNLPADVVEKIQVIDDTQ